MARLCAVSFSKYFEILADFVSRRRAGSKKETRGSEQLVLDAVRSGMQFQKFVADAALKV